MVSYISYGIVAYRQRLPTLFELRGPRLFSNNSEAPEYEVYYEFIFILYTFNYKW